MRLHPHTALLTGALVAVVLIAPAVPAPAQPAYPTFTSPAHVAKLDPALRSRAWGAADTITVWASFADKLAGAGPEAWAVALADAWSAMSPRARARRLRIGLERADVHDLPVARSYLESLERSGLHPFAVSRWLNRAAVRVTAAQLSALAAEEGVVAITPVARSVGPGDRVYGIRIVPGHASDAGRRAALSGAALDAGLAAGQLAQIGLPALHDAGFTGSGRLVCLIDQGFNFYWKHDALRHRVLDPGFARDFVEGDTVVFDTTNAVSFVHGTWAYGCIGGDLPGIYVGSAPGASFALARTEDNAGETPVEMLYWAQAAEWADSLGADIVSSSVGYNRFDAPFPDYGPADMDGRTTDVSRAAQFAASRGLLVVNAVGNGGFGPAPTLAAPADVHGDSLISVGAVDTFGSVASFSSRGPTSDGRIKPDVVARGAGAWIINADGLPDAYELGDGTSFAAPLVAGLAACLMQARPDMNPVEIVQAIRETASGAGFPNVDRGWGIPDAGAARSWVPWPPGVTRPPAGYVELVNTAANPVRTSRAPLRLRFGLGPRSGAEGRGHLRILDTQGREVRRLFSGELVRGRWVVANWDGTDHAGRRARPGIYFAYFEVQGRFQSLRIALLD